MEYPIYIEVPEDYWVVTTTADVNGEEELLYTSLDYSHPPVLSLDPPLQLSSGQSLISRATYYNDTDFEVNFGLFSTDEMMLIFGLGYFD